MSQPQTVLPLVFALVLGGFTTVGVVLKIGYDSWPVANQAQLMTPPQGPSREIILPAKPK